MYAQVRLFDPHFGGVIAKGTLLPLNSRALPPNTIVLRQSQVKAPAGREFWEGWSTHWQQLLLWAHQQHLQQQRSTPQHGMPPQPQAAHSCCCGMTAAGGAAGSNSANGSSGSGVRCSCSNTGVAAGGASFAAAVQAAADAAVNGPRADVLRCFHAQDQPWLQQLWYVHDARQLCQRQRAGYNQRAGSSSSNSAKQHALPPPSPTGCRQQLSGQQQQQPQQQGAAGSAGNSGGTTSSSSSCSCGAVLEVVTRPPDSTGRPADISINKNLLLLLHDAGVPAEVFER